MRGYAREYGEVADIEMLARNIQYAINWFISSTLCIWGTSLDPRPSFRFYNGGEQLGLVLVVCACASRLSDSDEWIFSFTFVTFIFVYYRVLEVSSRFIIIGKNGS